MGNQASSLNSDVYVSLESSSATSVPMNILDFIRRYRKHLPLVVSTRRMKKKSKASFGEGHSLCVHFHKESDIVVAISKDGAKYAVPVRSSFMCSPLYDHPSKKGSVFEGVRQLLEFSPLPQLVYTIQGYLSPSGDEDSSVEEGQILVIKGAEVLNGENTLWCIDICSFEQKNLEMSCTASFSTDTALLKAPLATLIDHLTLPASVVFSAPNDATCAGFPEALVCTITSKIETQSIITSPYTMNLSPEPPQHVVEILADAPLHVCVVSLPREEERVLKEKTRKLLTTFSPSLIAEVIGHIATPVDTKIQTALFQYLEQDYYWSKEFINKELISTLNVPPSSQTQTTSHPIALKKDPATLQNMLYDLEEDKDTEETYEEVATLNPHVTPEELASIIPLPPNFPAELGLSSSVTHRHSIDSTGLTSKEDSNRIETGTVISRVDNG